MTTDANPTSLPKLDSVTPESASAVEGLDRISTLLGNLGRSESTVREARADQDEPVNHENQFLAVRLGVATSLFYCLRSKHRQTADHSVRVSLGCSAWAERLGLPDDIRDRLEVASLLHDVGKIATPDRILKKPTFLSNDERSMIDQTPLAGCEILQGCCNDQDLLDIIRYSRNWYRNPETPELLSGEDLPLGSRMLMIVEAFDSMTSDHAYRRALSRERAVAELFEYAGTQFDPNLVRDYATLLESRPEVMYGSIARRWLHDLADETSNQYWSPSQNKHQPVQTECVAGQLMFHQQLLDTMGDGVVAIDREGVITHWNLAFERMTNVSADAMVGSAWSDQLIRWYDPREEDAVVHCSLENCLVSGLQSQRRMRMVGLDGKETPVKVNFMPVLGDQSAVRGALAIVSDISEEESLEKAVQTLQVKATRDGLTGIANRAEFDRALRKVVDVAAEGKHPASLVLCDIDRFKDINDNYGHQAGDDILVNFAAMLARHSRDGDLVARYGGEEFVLLCPGCDNATAAKRAEAIRQELEAAKQPSIDDKCITSSFGVTEYQPGDTEATMIARADRALYKAKENGRNRVVQLGSGSMPMDDKVAQEEPSGWFSWLARPSKSSGEKAQLTTFVPIEMVIEKMRGFIADHDAEILKIGGQSLEMRMNVRTTSQGRRRIDAVAPFLLSIDLSERLSAKQPRFGGDPLMETVIDASVSPWRARDRRGHEIKSACRNVLASLKSYLMADYAV